MLSSCPSPQQGVNQVPLNLSLFRERIERNTKSQSTSDQFRQNQIICSVSDVDPELVDAVSAHYAFQEQFPDANVIQALRAQFYFNDKNGSELETVA